MLKAKVALFIGIFLILYLSKQINMQALKTQLSLLSNVGLYSGPLSHHSYGANKTIY